VIRAYRSTSSAVNILVQFGFEPTGGGFHDTSRG